MRTAIQLYTLRELDEPLARTLRRIAETPLEGVELGAGSVADADVRDALAETGLGVASLGADPEELLNPGEGLAETCRELGVEHVGVGYFGPEHFESADAIRGTAGRVSAFVNALAAHDLTAVYHNHDHEFATLDDGRTAFDVFEEHVDDRLEFELDLGWIGTGGEDPAERLASLGDRTPLVHVKDMHFAERAFADLGTGDLDVEGLVEIAREQGVEWAVYEHDEPDDPLAALDRDSRVLAEAVEATRPD